MADLVQQYCVSVGCWVNKIVKHIFLQDSQSTGWQRRGQNQTKEINKRHVDRNLKEEEVEENEGALI